MMLPTTVDSRTVLHCASLQSLCSNHHQTFSLAAFSPFPCVYIKHATQRIKSNISITLAYCSPYQHVMHNTLWMKLQVSVSAAQLTNPLCFNDARRLKFNSNDTNLAQQIKRLAINIHIYYQLEYGPMTNKYTMPKCRCLTSQILRDTQ